MNIIWLGHSCFVVESAGWRIVLDPYYVETYPALHIEADEALCSHGHRDHAFLEAVTLSGRDKSESPFTVETVSTFHDDKKGSLRGENAIHILRAEGLKVGFYYSLIDWHHPDFMHKADIYHPDRSRPDVTDEGRDFNRYLAYMHGQVEELVTNYGKIDVLWFDFAYDSPVNGMKMRGETWRATELMSMVRELQPQVITDNRLEVSGEGYGSLAECNPTPYHGDFVTPERIIPPTGILDAEGNPLAWESCITMNDNWGYCSTDTNYKPSSLLIHKLVECVSKGGNLILNVGPDATGRFPEQSCAILKEIGAWMARNSQSIYGAGMAAGGPIEPERPEWGRITRNGNTYYFHLYENALGPVPLMGVPKDRIESIRLLRDGSEVKLSTSWTHSDYPDIAFADLGPSPYLPDPVDTVLAVKIKEN